jgi:hypothetical protein
MNLRSIGGNRHSIRWSCLNKTETRQDEALSTENRWVSSGSSDVCVEANKDDLAAGSSAPDEPTVRQCIAWTRNLSF